MVALLQEVLGVPLNVSRRAQFMGAIGAGLYALDQLYALDHMKAGDDRPAHPEEAHHGAGRRH
jgi:hypothetical protein